jgi:hypothetical protein
MESESESESESEFTRQKRLLDYWRISIKNESILGVQIHGYDKNFVEIDMCADSKFSIQETKNLFKQHVKLIVKIPAKASNLENIDNKKEIRVLPIRIAPFVYGRSNEGSQCKGSHKKSYFHPVWILAYLEESGNLFTWYPCILPPFIARNYLTPSYNDETSLTIGSMADYDKFLDVNNINSMCQLEKIDDKQRITWQYLYKYAEKMLDEVAPSLSSCLQQHGYATQKKVLILPSSDNQGQQYSLTLLKLLDSLSINNEKFSPLLANYLSLKQSPTKPLMPIIEQLECCADKHLGQMTGNFALAKSQRIALHHLLSMPEDGHILAINGPPGTGKTALLSSIIGSFWVQAALKKELPSIIVVSSSNNRAILNVVDSFESKTIQSSSREPAALLEQRWIKGVTSFGLYLTNKKDVVQQRLENRRGNLHGTLQEIAQGSYVEIKDYYLKSFNTCFNLQVFSVAEVTNILHSKMVSLEVALQQGLKIAVKHRQIINFYPKYVEESKLCSKVIHLKSCLQATREKFHSLNKLKIAWSNFISQVTVNKVLVFFVPFLRKRLEKLRIEKIENFLLNHELIIEPVQATIENYFKTETQKHCIRRNRLGKLIDNYTTHLNNMHYVKREWETWKNTHTHGEINLDLNTLFEFDSVEKQTTDNVLIFLDTKLRYKLFQYATHYWEGKWLLETFEARKNGMLDSRLNSFKRMAMLAPCFITTMQSGPGFFVNKITQDQDFAFMKNSIDLLIIDEAGQVHPGYGAGMFALAKKACVVGDNLQLPPIINMPGAVDIGNMQQNKVINSYEEYHKISEYGANISVCSINGAGSVMKVAQNASYFQDISNNDCMQERGLFLSEHRRCVPGIISYCNEYFYKNKMSYNRPGNTNRPFTAMGYAHISGLQEGEGDSQANDIEAMTIVKWINDNKQKFFALYPGKKLEQIFGIITPFKAQVGKIQSYLTQQRLDLPAGNIGTIHTFQGGEFPVIIFSPVYSCSEQKNYFFDTEKSMLNVAVSRAKDHFFVFGDMEIFDPRKISTPSGFLADYLFSNPENELINVAVVRKIHQERPEIVRHINTLDGHRQVLTNAFQVAKKRVLLISPWIRDAAIAADNIVALIKSATSRNVVVVIYSDQEKNIKSNNKVAWLKLVQVLETAGAKVRVVDNMHAKTLIVDDTIFIEGSFNWLSASRSKKYANYESSICCEGSGIDYYIDNFMKQRFENRSKRVNYHESAKYVEDLRKEEA